MNRLTVVPPSSFGGLTLDCGNGSESIKIESPIASSACAIVSFGPGMRPRSVAPNAFL